jgi:3-oxoacyl-[acyl-carrier-protein] synthase II
MPLADLSLRRVAITGVGLISPVGIGTEETWKAVCEGRSGVGPITAFDASLFRTHIAAEVKSFDAAAMLDRRCVRKTARFTHLALGAADFALEMARLTITPANADQVGVYIGNAVGGIEVVEREHRVLLKRGPGRLSPHLVPAAVASLAAGHLSIRLGAKGPSLTVSLAGCSAAYAIGDSFRLIREGEADVMICGGTEAAITPLFIGGLCARRALSVRNCEPTRASRPWDRQRDGFVLGEGAAILVLEEWECARRRGAFILAEVAGFAINSEAVPIDRTSPCASHTGMSRAMRGALSDASIHASEVQYLSADAASQPKEDRIEALSIQRVFQDYASRLVVSATKSMTGHLIGAAAGLEAALTALAIRDQIAPPTINLDYPDDDHELYVIRDRAQPLDIEYAVTNSSGFGGVSATLVLARPDRAKRNRSLLPPDTNGTKRCGHP